MFKFNGSAKFAKVLRVFNLAVTELQELEDELQVRIDKNVEKVADLVSDTDDYSALQDAASNVRGKITAIVG